MPTIPLPPGDYWRLRFAQEVTAHANTRALLGQMRAAQAQAEIWHTLTAQYSALATAETWTLTDETCTLSAPDEVIKSVVT